MELTYAKYKSERQAQFDKIPIGAAFSNEQFKRTMENWGLTVNDTDKIVSLGGGCFIQVKDVHYIDEFYEQDKMPEFMQDKEFRTGAFLYEMCNHEYMYNFQKDWDVCGCFYEGKEELPYLDDTEDKPYVSYLKIMGHEDWVADYEEAIRKYWKLAEENDWG